MGITFVTWLWGNKYSHEHVLKLANGVRRHYRQLHRFIVFADRHLSLPRPIEVKLIENPELQGRGCFCRLRMFDPAWQVRHGLDDKIVSLDLDLVITKQVDALFERHESFLILQGVNATNPNPFNCSLMMLRAGKHADVWREFSVQKASAIRFYEFPDDQAWIWHMMPSAAGWRGGSAWGIYGFQKPGWPVNCKTTLPSDARIVAFFGKRKPELYYATLPWLREHWK